MSEEKLDKHWENVLSKVNEEEREFLILLMLVCNSALKAKYRAIEYINNRMVHEGEYYIRRAFHFRNTEYGKDLLEILGGNNGY